jgi:hypothetical protein
VRLMWPAPMPRCSALDTAGGAERQKRAAARAAEEVAARVAAEVAERAASTRDGSLLAKLAELTEAEARGVPGAHAQVMDCLFEIQAACLELPLAEPVEPAGCPGASRRGCPGASRDGCPGASRGRTWLERKRRTRTRFAGASVDGAPKDYVGRHTTEGSHHVPARPNSERRQPLQSREPARRTHQIRALRVGLRSCEGREGKRLLPARRRAKEQKHQAASESAAKPPRKAMAPNPYKQAKAPAPPPALAQRAQARYSERSIVSNTGITGNTQHECERKSQHGHQHNHMQMHALKARRRWRTWSRRWLL